MAVGFAPCGEAAAAAASVTTSGGGPPAALPPAPSPANDPWPSARPVAGLAAAPRSRSQPRRGLPHPAMTRRIGRRRQLPRAVVPQCGIGIWRSEIGRGQLEPAPGVARSERA